MKRIPVIAGIRFLICSPDCKSFKQGRHFLGSLPNYATTNIIKAAAFTGRFRQYHY
jgi:hypothetical protein